MIIALINKNKLFHNVAERRTSRWYLNDFICLVIQIYLDSYLDNCLNPKYEDEVKSCAWFSSRVGQVKVSVERVS